MQQILKRLELIKTSIALEDEEIIELQIIKIKSLTYDSDVASILTNLDANDYAMAVNSIEMYLNKNTGLAVYKDKELQGLKLELKVLERKLQGITEQKSDCDLEVEDFNREYSLRLGQVIQRVLGLREKILHHKIAVKDRVFQDKKEQYDKARADVADAKKQATKLEDDLDGLDEFSEDYDELYTQYQALKEELSQKEHILNEKRKEAKLAKAELEDDPVNSEYEEAKQDSETFDNDYNELIAEESFDLDVAQKKELKDAYRRASRLCHPDLVVDELKDQAHKIMTELNIAKKKKDLARVKEILHSLQTGEGFEVASDSIQDKEVLKSKLITIKKKIGSLEAELDELEASDAYKNIQEIDDADEYFESIKVQLQEESERLEVELGQLQNESDTTHQNNFDFSIDNTATETAEKPTQNSDLRSDDEFWKEEF